MIRKAEQRDIKKIVELYDRVKLDRSRLDDLVYRTEVQKNGFLLGLDTLDTFVKELTIAYDFIVAEENGKIIGYLIADHREEERFYDDEYKTWFDKEIKDFYYQSTKGMTLASIAVGPGSSRKGVATELLSSLEKKLVEENYKYLFSVITLAPLTNCPTIAWHTKNGFQRLAMGRPRKLFGLDNYSGVLLYKRLR